LNDTILTLFETQEQANGLWVETKKEIKLGK
jgi:hypothetical protein